MGETFVRKEKQSICLNSGADINKREALEFMLFNYYDDLRTWLKTKK